MAFGFLARSTVLCCLLASGCSADLQEHARPVDTDVAAMRQLADEWRAAARAGAVDEYMNLLTADVVMLVPLQPVMTGQEAVRAFVQSFFKEYRISAETWQSDEIVAAGEWAYDRGTYSATYVPSASTASFLDVGTYLIIARRQPGG